MEICGFSNGFYLSIYIYIYRDLLSQKDSTLTFLDVLVAN
uniref:Uncharacterized protein n=1 Tax=Rhizophora mucronata TaxID=61149 RepID=A0A2P2IL40_RHIMU